MFFLYLSVCISVDSSCCVLLSQCLLLTLDDRFIASLQFYMARGSQKLTGHELGICEFYSLKIDLYGMDTWRSLQKAF